MSEVPLQGGFFGVIRQLRWRWCLVQDVHRIWWRGSKGDAPKNLSRPVYEILRDVGLAPNRPTGKPGGGGEKPEHVCHIEKAETYSYGNDNYLKRMVSSSRKKSRNA